MSTHDDRQGLRLTLRTLLAYLDDTLSAADSRLIGQKLAAEPAAEELVERVKKLVRRRSLTAPPFVSDGSPSDPVVVASYLSDTLHGDKVAIFEKECLDSDSLLAEIAACHQVLTIVDSQPVRVPPTARRRMCALVAGRESIPNRPPNPAIPPVGGAHAEERFDVDPDDADAALLMGMTAYSRSDSRGRRLAKVGAAVGLAVAAVVAVWMALPPLERTGPGRPTDPVEVAVAAVPPPVSSPVIPPKTPATKVDSTTTDPDPDPKIGPMPPMPPMPPEKKGGDGPDPKVVDPVVVPDPPKEGRGKAGRVSPPTAIVLQRPANADDWTRVGPVNPTVYTADDLLALPGSRGSLDLETGARVELWGNLPELLSAPLLWSAVTLHDPYDGFAADLTVHNGRVYLTTDDPAGANVRLRFAGEVWDVSLADDKTDVAFEIIRTPTPGAADEPARTSVGLAVVRGTAGLKVRYKSFPEIPKDQVVHWDSQGRGLEGPQPLPADGQTYFARTQLYPDKAASQAAFKAVNDLNERLTDPSRVQVAVAEAMTSDGPVSLQSVTAERMAVLAEAAIGNVSVLTESAADPNRPHVREAAAFGLRTLLASDPSATGEFRDLLVEKSRLSAEQADTVVRLLRGLAADERTSPAMLDQLVELLDADKLIVRELAFTALLNEVDPESRPNRGLSGYDAAAPEDVRAGFVRRWKQRVDEIKAKKPEPKME